MGTNVFLAPPPILQFLNNAGAPAAGGSVLTQVGGINFATYQDSGGNTPLPNPIPLNSRGEISNSSGVSCQLFLQAGVVYTFTLYDINGNQLNQSQWMGSSAIQQSDYASGNLERVVDTIAALRSLSHANYARVFVTGYYTAGDDGGGHYWYNSADTTSADNGGTIIVDASGGRWYLDYAGVIRASQWGFHTDGTNATANNTVFANIATFVAAQTTPPKIIFGSGIYAYSVCPPNLAVNHGCYVPDGDVRLRYSGTGQAVILDGGSVAPNLVQDFTFGADGARFTVEAGKGSTNGVFARALLNGCRVNVAVRGCGTSSAGILINWCVLADFSGSECAPYVNGWYNDGTGAAQPQHGFWLDQRAVSNEQTSVCCFIDCYAASCSQDGWVLANAQGNFIGASGDSEFNGAYGMVLQAGAVHNRIIGMNFEQNTAADILDNGSHNEFLHLTTGSVNAGSHQAGGIQFGATCSAGAVLGGWHDQITMNTGATACYIGAGAKYASNGGTITDAGTRTRYGDTYNINTGLWLYGPAAVAQQITPGASPWTYTNNTGRPIVFGTAGGTIGSLAYFRGAQQVFAIPGQWGGTLYSGDSVSITYSVVPAVYIAPIQ